MKSIVKDLKGKKLCVGSKEQCMHFIKRRGYKRGEITIGKYTELHYTIPQVVQEEPNIKIEPVPWFKRIYEKL